MIVRIPSSLKWLITKRARLLATIKKVEQESEGCYIGAVGVDKLYLRCPNAKHGVLVERNEINDAVISWAIHALINSLIIQA